MIAAVLFLAMLVGIADVCPTNGCAAADYGYLEAIRRAGHVPVVITRAPRPTDYAKVLAQLDVLLLPGGEDVNPALYGAAPSLKLGRVNTVRDAFEQDLLEAAVARELPIFGICRGVQRLNVFFGGTLYQDIPSEHPRGMEIPHPDGGHWENVKCVCRHGIDIAADSRLAHVCGVVTAQVNSAHHQAVKEVAPGMRITAWSADGVVEGIESVWYPAAGVQFHPEWLVAGCDDPIWLKLFANMRQVTGKRPRMALRRRPIGVLGSGDSGLRALGTLLVVDQFNNATGAAGADGTPDFAAEDFVYFDDSVRATDDCARVLRGGQFLLGAAAHAPAKAVLVLDAMASAKDVEALANMPRPHHAPVIGPLGTNTVEAVAGVLAQTLRANKLLNNASVKSPDERVKAFESMGSGTRIVPMAVNKLKTGVSCLPN